MQRQLAFCLPTPTRQWHIPAYVTRISSSPNFLARRLLLLRLRSAALLSDTHVDNNNLWRTPRSESFPLCYAKQPMVLFISETLPQENNRSMRPSAYRGVIVLTIASNHVDAVRNEVNGTHITSPTRPSLSPCSAVNLAADLSP